jgi:hypothetical protein
MAVGNGARFLQGRRRQQDLEEEEAGEVCLPFSSLINKPSATTADALSFRSLIRIEPLFDKYAKPDEWRISRAQKSTRSSQTFG